MQLFLIVIGVFLIAFGLYFAIGGVGTGPGRGAFRDAHIEGPAWLVLVAIGVFVVMVAAFGDWTEDGTIESDELAGQSGTDATTTTVGASTEDEPLVEVAGPTTTTMTPTTTTTPPTTTVLVTVAEPPEGSLRVGHAGSRVLAVERALGDLDYLPESAVDGVFDGNTDAALRRFQGDRGIGVDGLAGPQTHAELGLAYAAPGSGDGESDDPAPDLDARPPDAVTLPCDGSWILSLGSTRAERTHPDDFRNRLREQYEDQALRLIVADSCASLAPGAWVVAASTTFESGEAVKLECRKRGLTSGDDCLGIPLTDAVADRDRRVFP